MLNWNINTGREYNRTPKNSILIILGKGGLVCHCTTTKSIMILNRILQIGMEESPGDIMWHRTNKKHSIVFIIHKICLQSSLIPDDLNLHRGIKELECLPIVSSLFCLWEFLVPENYISLLLNIGSIGLDMFLVHTVKFINWIAALFILCTGQE